MKIIRLNTDRIELLSDYLHDADLYKEDISFDSTNKLLILQVWRAYIEDPRRKKVLFIVPFVSYPKIETILRIHPVTAVDIEYVHEQARDRRYRLTLTSFSRSGSGIVVKTDGIILRAFTTNDVVFELHDTSSPSHKRGIVDLFMNDQGNEYILTEIKKYMLDV
jgi:hypothetical protein